MNCNKKRKTTGHWDKRFIVYQNVTQFRRRQANRRRYNLIYLSKCCGLLLPLVWNNEITLHYFITYSLVRTDILSGKCRILYWLWPDRVRAQWHNQTVFRFYSIRHICKFRNGINADAQNKFYFLSVRTKKKEKKKLNHRVLYAIDCKHHNTRSTFVNINRYHKIYISTPAHSMFPICYFDPSFFRNSGLEHFANHFHCGAAASAKKKWEIDGWWGRGGSLERGRI